MSKVTLVAHVKEPIRICHIIGNYVGGGVESVVMNYYRHIDRTKVQFDFVCCEGSTCIPYDEIEKLGGRIFIVPRYSNLLSFDRALKKIFLENKYNIVHSHINTLSVFPLRVAKKCGVSVRIAHSHSTTNKKEFRRNVLKQVLRPFSKVYATDYFACSEYAGRWLFGNKAFDKGEVYVLNNAINLDNFKFDVKVRNKKRKELRLSKDAFVIGHVGRFVVQKNHTFLIDVFYEVLKTEPKAVLILAGEGELMPKMKEKVKRLGIEKSVMFLGQRNDLNEVYQTFDVFVMPSLYEGLGMTLIEAQCMERRCITSTNIPREAKISNLLIRIPLTRDIESWASHILDRKDENTSNAKIDSKPYNITIITQELQARYLGDL